MDFRLEISNDNVTYNDVDLFPNQQLEYDLDFYDSLEADKVKLPFYTKIRIPLTDTNQASNRFDFDPFTSSSSDFPKDEFYFKVHIEGLQSTTISGILNVLSFEYNSSQPIIEVELKDYITKFISTVKETPLGEIYNDNYYTSRMLFFDFYANTPSDPTPGEAGTIDQNPDYSRPIHFPYVDFCNDVQGKFGYAARQFLEYGPYMSRTGIVPVFSVNKFLEYMAREISTPDFPMRIDSNLLGLGTYDGNPFFPQMQPEKLQMLLPAHLLAKQDKLTRNFTLLQAPAWTGTNQSMDSCGVDGDDNQKILRTGWFGNMETAGHYGTDAEGGPIYNEANTWGASKRMGFYPDDNDEGIRGFFAPKVSFNAAIKLSDSRVSADIIDAKIEFPVMKEDKLVTNLIIPNAESTMTFKPFVGVYADGFMVKKIPLQDVNGDDIVLGMDDISAIEEGDSNKSSNSDPYDFYQCDEGHENHGIIIDVGATYTDRIVFESFTAYLPSDQEIFINQGSQYSINYFIEPLDGTLRVEYATEFAHGGSHHTVTARATSTFGVNDVKKAITRISSYGQLNIEFEANQDFLPYGGGDEIIIQDSILQTCPLTVLDVFKAVLKRFNCGVFYDYDSNGQEHILRVDPLHIARSGVQNINELVDDLKSVKIYSSGDKVKSLELNNKDYGLYFDDFNDDGITIGSTTQEIANDGISEVKIDFDSSIYYNSVCGDESEESLSSSNFGAFSAKELGFTSNLFTPISEVGVRFAYLDKPLYRTNILGAAVKLKGFDQSGKMNTESQIVYKINTAYVMAGRLRHLNTEDWSLLFEDEDGVATDTYTNLFADSEKIIQANQPTIEFDMVVPTSNLSDLSFFLQRLTATRFTSNSIYVKSATGDVYEDYAYLTIKGILQ